MSETKTSDLVELDMLIARARKYECGDTDFPPYVTAQSLIAFRAQLAAAEANYLDAVDGEYAACRLAETLQSQLKIVREALEAMLVDPPSDLNEPDMDCDVIFKMRGIASEALNSLTEGSKE